MDFLEKKIILLEIYKAILDFLRENTYQFNFRAD